MITSPGEFPSDRNLYQLQKALSAAETKENSSCTFIIVAESKDGYGEGVINE